MRANLAPVELFLDVNKILYHKRALHLLFGKDDQKKGNELPYTTDDVQKMLDITKIKRNRAVFLFYQRLYVLVALECQNCSQYNVQIFL